MKYLLAPEWKGLEDRSGIGIRKSTSVTVKGAGGGNGHNLRFIISDSGVDRDGDTIDVNGWDLGHYKANPVILWGHDSSLPPVGRSAKIWVKEGRLMSIAEPVPEDIQDPRGYGFGAAMFRLYREGFMNAVSVGFMPIEAEESDRDGAYPLDFKRQELLEYSLVPVPSNPRALLDAEKAGHDIGLVRTWAERVLDETRGEDESAAAIAVATDDKKREISIPAEKTAEEEGIDMEELAKLQEQYDVLKGAFDSLAAQHKELQLIVDAMAGRAKAQADEEATRGLVRAAIRDQLEARAGKE